MSTQNLTLNVNPDEQDERQHRRHLSVAVNRVLDGKINATGTVTLTASQATTAVTELRIGNTSLVLFMPLTANAAAEMDGMYVSAQDARAGTFTITHANNAQTDRDFRYAILG